MNKIKKKNSEEIKKKKEKFWAEKLINTLSLKGELIPLMGEKQPDFQFPIEEKTVGIELVRIYTNTEILGIESVMKEIAISLKNKFDNQKYFPKCEIKLTFAPNNKFPQKFSSDESANRIYNMILDEYSKKNPNSFAITDQVSHLNIDLSEAETEENLVKISITFGKYLDKNIVFTPHFVWALKNFINILKNAIDKKEMKLPDYKINCRCSEFWLLVYAEGIGGTDKFLPDEETLCKTYFSNFDKVFFMTNLSDKSFELKLTKSKLPNPS